MTLSEVMALEAGPETDALVAEKVMGWHLSLCQGKGPEKTWPLYDISCDCVRRTQYGHLEKWSPSTDISAAWEVLERTAKTEVFMEILGEVCLAMDYFWLAYMPAEDAALAICRAALMTEGK